MTSGPTREAPTDLDVVVLGAGFTGLYAMYKFRDEMGLTVRGLEPAGGPGGVWYWNRYPGARCDFPSLFYSFSFSPEVDREWRWSEKYAAQPEILAYLEFVCDRLDLRRSFDWGVGAESLTWDDDAKRWIVPTSDGRTLTARFVLCGTGGLSIPKEPDFPGRERFRGEYYTTRNWPHHPVSFEGKRVGVIGTGASGIQVIQEVAKTADELVVFQRTPNFATPMRNRTYAAEEQDWNAGRMTEIRATASPVSGADLGQIRPSIFAEPPEAVRAHLTELYEAGGLGFAFASYADVLYDPNANAIAADFIHEQIRARVHDPKVAELLCPTDHPYTAKRPPLETNYYEVYNQPNVTLVDVASAPIVEVTEDGVRTVDGEYELDMIITALGFDAFTGAQLALPMSGRGGVRLADYWADGPLDYLGMAIHDFPNYFQIGVGPSAASQHNNAPLSERQIDFAAAAIQTVLDRGAATVEPSAEADAQWKVLCDGLIPFTLLHLAKSTWFLGHNIDGKPPAAYAFYAGAPLYFTILEQLQHMGWAGFEIDGVDAAGLPPLVRLDPGAANFVGAMMMSGAPPLDQVDLETMRMMVSGQGMMQVPGPDVPTIDLAEPRVRVYSPPSETPLPVVIAYHGGGFVAGNADSIDPLCRNLAVNVGAVVVNVDYRLAPEHPFPAAVDDAVAVLRWVREYIADHGGDPQRIAVLGDSAGGNLATVVARHAATDGLPLGAQVLVYPLVDGEAETPSKREFFHGPFLSVPAGDRFWQLYLGGAEVTPDAAPLRATDLAGSAPALVLTMGIDPLRDEGETYAARLREAGVEVEHHRFDGLIHATWTFSKLIPRAAEVDATIVEFLRRRLAASGAGQSR
jgi:cation diffusion facilitator CzcD-associated flavoprotein CzcO/acetyl esterase/lipase